MQLNTKISLSKKELDFLNDGEFFQSKRIITQKVTTLFDQLCDEIKASNMLNNFNFPKNTNIESGKITKGENYKGLPYIVLDFPRLFEKNDIFTLRTLLWWGNYYSFSLHLSGKPLEMFRTSLIRRLAKISLPNSYFNNSNNQWLNDVNHKSFIKTTELTPTIIETQIKLNGFVRITNIQHINDSRRVLQTGLTTYERYLSMLNV